MGEICFSSACLLDSVELNQEARPTQTEGLRSQDAAMPFFPRNPLPAMVVRAFLGAYGLANLTTAAILAVLYVLKELGLILR